jgi:eukaryotic-like serine/threonine-protein kinase
MRDDPEESPVSVPPGTIVCGRYRAERRLGAGGMGEVYLVQHVHTDERFAMKVLLSTVISDQTALERFRREARTPARIDSEHVVRVTDADVAKELHGAPFLVMEYLRGEDLDHHVTERGPMNRRDVVTFLQQAARALDKAHALGIVHRDLKPENIFITKREDGSPHVKILDFGIAKFTSGATSDLINKTATSPGQIYGTPLYMAPEQAKGESKKISPQTDIWALGLIANRMLSGKDYWDAETLTALIAQVVYEPMQTPAQKGFDFGPKYDQWFMRCCDRDPEARFSTAGEAVFKLGQALGVIDIDVSFQPGVPSSVTAAPPPSLRQASEPRPLSRTELQLAQTGLAARSKPAERGPFVKIAIAASLAGVAIAVAVYALRKPTSDDRVAAQPTLREERAASATGEASADGPIVLPGAARSAEPLPTVEPSVSVEVASASASIKAVPVRGGGLIKRPPGTPTSTATTKPVDPPKDPKKDPLDGRL